MPVVSRTRRRLIGGLGAATLIRPAFPALPANAKTHQDLTWYDAERKRTLPLRFRYPSTEPPWPLIVYSPGLGSGTTNGAAWCDAWRDAGLMVVTIAHPETDDGIWDATRGTLRSHLRVALNWSQLGKRVNDCRFIIDQWTNRPQLTGFVDRERIAAAGHSYGALTVQALSGQLYDGKPLHRDRRVTAAIAFSPGAISLDSAKGAAGIAIPFLCVTGDRDGYVTFGSGEDSMRLGVPLENRTAIYQMTPPGAKHLLVLAGADHMTFAGEPLQSNRYSRSPGVNLATDHSQWKKVSAITTQFWKRYLFPSVGSAAAAFPDHSAGVLGSADRLESK